MARSDVLVSTDWAEQNLNTPKIVFVEVDEDTAAYDTGHIEGAIKLDWKKDLQDQVDVRGPRFAAWITTAVLVVVLIVATFSVPAAAVILALQAIVFAVGAAVGPRLSPYGRIYGAVVAPRVGPPVEREPTAPLRFAQLVGFIFAAAGLIGFVAGAPVVGAIFTAFALFAAFLNAAFGICLGFHAARIVKKDRLRAQPDSELQKPAYETVILAHQAA